MKRVNIYLNDHEKKVLSEVSKKYKASWSTIADKVCFYTYYLIKQKQLSEDILTMYIGKGEKTSIKPKCYKEGELLHDSITNKDLFTTNALKIYTNKEIKKYVKDEKYIQIYYDKINKALMEVKEQFYNYNNFIRSTMRSFKENKEYYRRKLETIR